MNSRKRVRLYFVSEKHFGYTGEPDQRSEAVSIEFIG
jgi:hypothetical protein